MRILDFYQQYPDEQSCRTAFKAYREKVGVTCRKCGGTEHYWKSKREQLEPYALHPRVVDDLPAFLPLVENNTLFIDISFGFFSFTYLRKLSKNA